MDFITALWAALVSLANIISSSLVSLFASGLALIYTPGVGEAPGTITDFGWIVASMAALGFIMSILYLVLNRLPKA